MNPALWLERAAQRYPDSPALLSGAEIVADYARFYARTLGLAGALRDVYGLGAGDHVAIFMSNRTEYLEVMYAAWAVGAAVVPINAKLHVREAAWIIGNAEAKLIVSAGTAADSLRSDPDLAGRPVIDVDGDGLDALCQSDPVPSPARLSQDDRAWIFYSSGTTGRPKGVIQTCGNIQAMTLAYFVDVDAADQTDAALYAAPMSHGAGCYNFVFTMRGARHVVPLSGGFDPAEIETLAPDIGNVCLFAAPTMVRRMVSQARLSGYKGDGLKTIVYGGGPMYVADIVEAVDVMGPRFVQIYGQAESPMTITALSRSLVADRTHPRWRTRLGSVGTAHSCVEVMIADQEGRELPRGEIGEILVRGATVMAGYWRNEEASRQALRGGWLWTGDMGAMDEDGFVTLHDRSKDMIISGGTNIYPREIEEVLLTHPAVAQVSVVGQADAEWGETVVAFVVPEAGFTQDEALLDAHCLAHIARFKRPKRYVFIDDLPKNAYGKVLKTELRQRLQAR